MPTDSATRATPCDADLDGNCSINFTGLALLEAAFFTSDPDTDFDGDGTVGFADLGIMKAICAAPGPSGVRKACAGERSPGDRRT